jgi:M-phase inducer tyrosine phosphatase
LLTSAKHLRRCDRTLNSGVYPRICYPEVYILEGGYSGFYNSQPAHCDPRGYVPMDDPKHVQSRNSDLHDFRKFSRTKSFTYGETQGPPPARAPLCPPLAFAAGSMAQNRRHGATIAEEGESPGASGNDTDASPCARVCSMGVQPIFGSAKTRTIGRGAFGRTASYAAPPRAPF